MKILSALTLAALLSTSAAFAADAPAATPAPAAAPAPSATHMAKGHSLKSCNKQADKKKLTGAERDSFVKECHSAKKS